MKWKSKLPYLLVERSPLAWLLDRLALRFLFFLGFNWAIAWILGEWYGGVALISLLCTLLLHWPLARLENLRLQKKGEQIQKLKERQWLKEQLSNTPEAWPQILAKAWVGGTWTRLKKGEYRREKDAEIELYRVVNGPLTLEEGQDFLAWIQAQGYTRGILLSLEGQDKAIQRLFNKEGEEKLQALTGQELLDQLIQLGAGPEPRELYDWLNKARLQLALNRQTWKERFSELKPGQLLLTTCLLVFLAPWTGKWAPMYWVLALLQGGAAFFLMARRFFPQKQ